MIVTSKNRTIPLSIPVGFFFLGEGFLLAFALLFALHPEALAVLTVVFLVAPILVVLFLAVDLLVEDLPGAGVHLDLLAADD
ncbi:hypothetical protein CSW33_05150, partial [Thermus scotoductus]